MKYLCIIALLLSLTNAWYGTGHVLTARIAQNIIEKKDPATYQKIVEILSSLKKSDPSWTSSEDKHPMSECATFADEIKGKGARWQSGWHFIDEPLLDEGGKIEDFNFTMDSHNVTEVIQALKDMYNNVDGYKDTYEYKTIMSHTYKQHDDETVRSWGMRFLIHYTGDVHQPLHATSRVNHEYPKGDRGGNDFPLPKKDGADELHAVWDSVIYEWTGYEKLPLSDADWESTSNVAQSLIDKYPLTDEEANEMDQKVWAHESFVISRDVVYKNDKENQALSQEYIDQAKPIAEKRLVLGGTRLANMLMGFKLAEPKKEAFLQ